MPEVQKQQKQPKLFVMPRRRRSYRAYDKQLKCVLANKVKLLVLKRSQNFADVVRNCKPANLSNDQEEKAQTHQTALRFKVAVYHFERLLLLGFASLLNLLLILYFFNWRLCRLTGGQVC